MDYSSFSHGQIHSKLWLCQELEKHIDKPLNVVIIGCWYNVLGFMMLTRNSSLYNFIEGIDLDQDSIDISNRICDAWMINKDQKIKNSCYNVSSVDFTNYDLVICTSMEDIEFGGWFDRIPKNKLVAIQTNNLTQDMVNNYPNWIIKNPNPNMETFKKKYSISDILFEGCKEFDYGDLKYSRYMLIGKK